MDVDTVHERKELFGEEINFIFTFFFFYYYNVLLIISLLFSAYKMTSFKNLFRRKKPIQQLTLFKLLIFPLLLHLKWKWRWKNLLLTLGFHLIPRPTRFILSMTNRIPKGEARSLTSGLVMRPGITTNNVRIRTSSRKKAWKRGLNPLAFPPPTILPSRVPQTFQEAQTCISE